MKKVPFNQEGLNLKIEMINSLNQNEFREELYKIQYETSDWVIDNFTLNEDQIEYTRLVPKELMTMMGFITSTCIATGQEVELKMPEVYQSPLASKRGIKSSIKGGGTWKYGTTPLIKLYGSISYTF